MKCVLIESPPSLQNGYTSLHHATSNGHAEVAKVLLEANAEVDAALEVRSECRRGNCVLQSAETVNVQGVALL